MNKKNKKVAKIVSLPLLFFGIAFADSPRSDRLSETCHFTTEELQKDTGHPVEISGFTTDDCVKFAKLSGLAYKVKKGEAYNVSDYGLTHLKKFKNEESFFDIQDNAGYVGEKENGEVIISFTGSTGMKNYITDAFFSWAKDHQNGGVYHNGILNAYRSVEKEVLSALSEIADKRNKTLDEVLSQTVITGHSLGGGMALVAADIFSRQGKKVKGVLTFAAPRTLDMVTATNYDKVMKSRTLVVKQCADPVPVISPGIIGAKQVGHQLYLPYSKNNTLHTLKGYISALEHMDTHGKISASQFSLFGLRPDHAEWNFESDPSKNASFQTFGTVGCSLAIRAGQRFFQDGRDAIYEIADAYMANKDAAHTFAKDVLTATYAAGTQLLSATYKSILWGVDNWQDTKKPTRDKVVEGVQNVCSFTFESISKTSIVMADLTPKVATPLVNSGFWIANKAILHTNEFVEDCCVLKDVGLNALSGSASAIVQAGKSTGNIARSAIENTASSVTSAIKKIKFFRPFSRS